MFDCNFRARCALEDQDCGDVRLDKILRIIKQCKYGIHDISRTELCKQNKLPRFNMPLELGLFLGAKRFGSNPQNKKVCLIMDKHKYRYQKFISDLAGQDILSHDNEPKKAIELITNWLRNTSGLIKIIPSGKKIHQRYQAFEKKLPKLCKTFKMNKKDIGFIDYSNLVSEWIKQNLRGEEVIKIKLPKSKRR